MSLMDIKFEKNYNNFVLNCNFAVDEKINGIFGPSGSGKSTLLNCIAGFTNPDSGKILIQGKTFYDLKKKILLPPEKRNIGYVTQKPNLFPSMNINENIHYGYKAGNKINIEDIIDMMNISDLLPKFPNQISGGQAQRAAIARGLVNRPTIVLADEPTGNLDSVTAGKVVKLAKTMAKELNQTFIIVTHDKHQFPDVDRIITIKDGKAFSGEETTMEITA